MDTSALQVMHAYVAIICMPRMHANNSHFIGTCRWVITEIL